MDIKINNFRIRVDQNGQLRRQLLRKYHLEESEVIDFKILRQAIDARRRDAVYYDYQIRLQLKKKHPELLKLPEISP